MQAALLTTTPQAHKLGLGGMPVPLCVLSRSVPFKLEFSSMGKSASLLFLAPSLAVAITNPICVRAGDGTAMGMDAGQGDDDENETTTITNTTTVYKCTCRIKGGLVSFCLWCLLAHFMTAGPGIVDGGM